MEVQSSPSVKISRLKVKNGNVIVVRDDLLRGGTKQRAAVPFLRSHMLAGINEFVYASPFSGYAQVALAYSCDFLRTNCTLFSEQHNGRMSEFTRLIADCAKVNLAENLFDAEQQAIKYCQSTASCLKIPLGFDDPLFKEYLKVELIEQWRSLCSALGFVPNRLWVPVGSGTLANIFSSILTDTELKMVDVQVLPSGDDRIKSVKSLCNSQYMKALEPFHCPAQNLPPIPSNRYYDAKLWQFVSAQAENNDVWWNVAR